MSKSVKLDHEFNKAEYTRLLKQALGNQSQVEFARKSNLSAAYLSKALNGRLTKPPIPSTLKKIATHAANNITYERLMDAAGYDVDTHLKKNIVPELPTEKIDPLYLCSHFEKFSLATITSNLSKKSYKWSTCFTDIDFDFSIAFYDEAITHWFFECMSQSLLDLGGPNKVGARLVGVSGKLMQLDITEKQKFSFVTDSEEIFEIIKQTPFNALSLYVSVILIDLASLSVIKEEYVESALVPNNEIFSHYSLK